MWAAAGRGNSGAQRSSPPQSPPAGCFSYAAMAVLPRRCREQHEARVRRTHPPTELPPTHPPVEVAERVFCVLAGGLAAQRRQDALLHRLVDRALHVLAQALQQGGGGTDNGQRLRWEEGQHCCVNRAPWRQMETRRAGGTGVGASCRGCRSNRCRRATAGAGGTATAAAAGAAGGSGGPFAAHLPHHDDGVVHQVANDLVHVAPVEPHLRKLGGLHLQARGTQVAAAEGIVQSIGGRPQEARGPRGTRPAAGVGGLHLQAAHDTARVWQRLQALTVLKARATGAGRLLLHSHATICWQGAAHMWRPRPTHLDKGRVVDFGQAPRDLGLAAAGGPDHEHVLGVDLLLALTKNQVLNVDQLV